MNSKSPSLRPAIRKVDLAGKERQLRSAVQAMTRIATAFCRASRRSLPFLVKQRGNIVPGAVESLASATEVASTPGDFSFTVSVVSADGLAWGAVTLTPEAIAIILEGALGGKASSVTSPIDAELSTAQRALLMRIGSSLAVDLAHSVQAEVGLAMQLGVDNGGASASSNPRAGDVLRVECVIEGLSLPSSVIISVSALALEAAAKEQEESEEPQQGDPRIAEALMNVELPVTAELGRLVLGLRAILELRPGDVLRLPTATDDPLRVRVSGVEKFDATPCVSRGQLAVEIKARLGKRAGGTESE